jgi:hypothetical protein
MAGWGSSYPSTTSTSPSDLVVREIDREREKNLLLLLLQDQNLLLCAFV